MSIMKIFWRTLIKLIECYKPRYWMLVKQYKQNLMESSKELKIDIKPWVYVLFYNQWKVEAIEDNTWIYSLSDDSIPFINSIKSFLDNKQNIKNNDYWLFFIDKMENIEFKYNFENLIEYIDDETKFTIDFNIIWKINYNISNMEDFFLGFMIWKEDMSIDELNISVQNEIKKIIYEMSKFENVELWKLYQFIINKKIEIIEKSNHTLTKKWLKILDFSIETINLKY